MLKFLNKILGDQNEKEVQRIQEKVEQINTAETKLQSFSDGELKVKTDEFKKRIEKGESPDDLLVEAFAVVKNACRRLIGQKFTLGKEEVEWNMVPYDVQLTGGIVLHEGKIAEMKTGEGKTLVAVLAVYLNALSSKGVHVITVNDYLASRDAEWMGNVYNFLGLTVGTIVHGLSNEERKTAYESDITYGTNNEFGFDYLRSNMATKKEDIVQRDLHYAIVDEVDSILIDESRTPLIISAPAEESTAKYQQYSLMVENLKEDKHYNIDEKRKTAILTEEGVHKMEQLLKIDNIYTEKGFLEVHHIEQALRAQTVYKKDVDYMVKDGEVIIVDEFTGRLMPGRRYSEGLHQAIEAKESVEVKRQSRTLATVTFQNYFRLYDKLSGMTGTALTEAEEFAKTYELDVIAIPTNQPVVREDKPDFVYKNERGKYEAIAKGVQEKYQKGQPVLLGTISIEKSEVLSQILKRNKIPHEVLNAKHHEKEAAIISAAGQKGAVTIATNMAGRGTDIKLGEGVKNLGGLAIIGSERHESRRIDNQLRGRAGRQGDPGETQFFVSLEDSLMRLFGSEKLQKMMEWAKIPDDMPIENRMISGAIESAQKKVEGHHFDIRKHLLEYDDVMNKHREIIYARRRNVLFHEDLSEEIQSMLEEEVQITVLNNTLGKPHEWNLQEIEETIFAVYHDESAQLKVADLEKFGDPEEVVAAVLTFLKTSYTKREKSLPDPKMMRELEKAVYLRTIDTLWMEHIDAMTYLRQNVSLRAYGQRDPLMEYKDESYRMLETLLAKIRSGTIQTLFKVQLEVQEQPKVVQVMPKVITTNEEEIEENITEEFGTESQEKESKPEPVSVETSKEPRKKESVEKTDSSDAKITVIKSDASLPQENLQYSGGGETQTIKAGGTIRNIGKVGRNEPCSCGSGKKYKKCHGKSV